MSAARSGLDAGATPVVVLLGGPSAEHDVSLVSGRAIAAALAARGHAVECWLIDLAGAWWQLPREACDPALPATAYDDPTALGAQGPRGAGQVLAALAARRPAPVAWIALHGPFGEDGTLQALCDAAGLVHTGSGVAASALGMDKSLFKRLVSALGMPVLPWLEIAAADQAGDPGAGLARLRAFAAGLPDRRLIVKPARLGSSIGMRIVHRPDGPELEEALAEAFRYDDLALAEAYLAGARELEVSVVGNGARDLATYGPGEVFPGHEFYDYSAKYSAGVSRTTDRPELSESMRRTVRELAARAFLAIGASGFARVDFLARGDEVHISEINTIPGFTPISLFPVLCAEGGYDFGGIAARIVELAVEREAYRPRARLTRADLP
ncbi:MAG TPA: D-alanine--D-alanine ligase [Candidatus Limnocylindrales bacterium]|nr:D-alanine--D-alanine ligase [Candidatus Limnocylindrales bacterium]